MEPLSPTCGFFVCTERRLLWLARPPHLWLMSKIPTRTWDDCRATSERKSRTHSYDDLVDLLIELALERENDSHMEKSLEKHLGRDGTPTPERGEGKGRKNLSDANQGGGKGRGNLCAMNEVKPDARTPPLFYCKPVNDKGALVMPLTATTAVVVCCK